MLISTPQNTLTGINPSFIKEYNKADAGNWHYDLITKRLTWSGRQFEIYGFNPGSVAINSDFFIFKTTHYTEIDRVNGIISRAMQSENSYNFRRRIIRNNGRIGFAETQAVILRDAAGTPVKIIGLTLDIGGKEAKGTIEFNDPQYFNALYTNYKKVIAFEIYKYVFNEHIAEDLCQEVFVKAWNNILQFDPQKGKIYTWLLSIARNHCRDYLSSKYHQTSKINVRLEEGLPKIIKNSFSNPDTNEIKDLLEKLPEDLFEITQLVYLHGYTQEEVAKIKQVPLGTVKTKSRRALMLLRNSFALN
ncbi:MAG: sigma-70 family RNA polymerase sigma factor [Bacteroidetes bacterium]|nr:sigma-70 family RNA polymerase sigma factor [Bacteroidota bacterium]